MWWWIIGGGIYLTVMVFGFTICKAADRADRDMGLK